MPFLGAEVTVFVWTVFDGVVFNVLCYVYLALITAQSLSDDEIFTRNLGCLTVYVTVYNCCCLWQDDTFRALTKDCFLFPSTHPTYKKIVEVETLQSALLK